MNLSSAIFGAKPISQPVESTLRQFSSVTGEIFTLEKWQEAAVEEAAPIIDLATITFYSDINKLLGAYYPSYTAERDRINPLVWHVIDTRFTEVLEYPLTKVIPSFAFSGAVFPYLTQLTGATTNVSLIDEFSTSSIGRLAPPFSGNVEIAFDNCNIREAFGLGIDTGETRGIVWIAYTSITDGTSISSISTTSDAIYFPS